VRLFSGTAGSGASLTDLDAVGICRGVNDLSETGEKKKMDRSPERRGGKRAPGTDLGDALKTAYDRTLNEAIPPEMLDLLGKLG